MDKYYMKPLVLVFLLIIAPVAAGLYGAMHDQISYTVSPEFFLSSDSLSFSEQIFPTGQNLATSVSGLLSLAFRILGK